MKPAGKGRYDSLYFDYPHFAFELPPELAGASVRHRVAIVGAGPVGMTAALELARHGVASVLLDDKETVNDGSRAICVSRHSYQILQQLGVVTPFLAKGLGWTHGRSYYRDHLVYRLEMPHSDDEKYLPMYNIQQQYIELYLAQACMRSPLIEMRWGSRVAGVDSGDDGVTLDVETPSGSYRLQSDWVLAADGARSRVRNMLGLSLEGENYEGRYVIVDVQMDHDFPTERRAFFEPAANPGGTVLIHRQPDHIWRIDYQLKPDEDEREAIAEANIRERVGAILAMIGHDKPWALEWWSIYTANTLCLTNYRHGRVLFVGDAAHIVPIFGVRGLNNGFADAVNVGWKLAWHVNGAAPESILDSYSPERRGATLDVFRNAGKSTRFMTPPSRGYRLLRSAVLSLAIRHDFARRFIDPRQVQPYTYADSPASSFGERDRAFEAGPAAGAVARNHRLVDGTWLLDHLGDSFACMVFGEIPPSLHEALAMLRERDARFVVLAIGTETAGDAAAPIADRDGTLAAAYGAQAGSVYLVRPDLHIAARWREPHPAEIIEAFDRCLGRSQ